MTGDRTSNTIPEMDDAPPDGARRTARQLFRELDGPGDEHFKQSLAGLSRGLSDRAARQSTNDPGTTVETRRAALQAYDLARARRLKTALGVTGAAITGIGLGCFAAYIVASLHVPSPRAIADSKVAAIDMAAIVPALAPPAASAEIARQTSSGSAPGGPASVGPATVASALEAAPLRRDEVKEIQMRLHSFGFNPGPVDGAAGPMTQAAVMRYQQNRKQLQTGTVDRELLDRLRRDPAPQVVAPQVAQRTARPARTSNAARRSDPFDPLRAAAQDFERWLQSLSR